MLDAIVFDFDGVIVDTEALHHQAFHDVMSPQGMGCSWEEYQRHFIGFDDRDAFRAMAARHGCDPDEAQLREWMERKAERFAQLAHGGGQPAKDGLPGLLRELRAAGLPIGLCSGALRQDIVPMLAALDLAAYFDILVTADDVKRSKPDPECYRLTLSKLSERAGRPLDPARCCAIEDTPTGIEAALGAGLKAVGLAGTFPAEALLHTLAVVSSLSELSVDRLHRLVAGVRCP